MTTPPAFLASSGSRACARGVPDGCHRTCLLARIGRCLFDKPRGVSHELARSENVWERRTAIVATYYFIRQGDVADTFGIAECMKGEYEKP